MYNLFEEFFLRVKEGFEIFADFANTAAEEIVAPLLKGILWVLLFFTLPIWIIPFLLMKKRRGTRNNDNKETEEALVKKGGVKPKNQQYIDCNFETVAECPNCQAKVFNSIGFTDAECRKCGQMLDWGK